MTNASNNGYTRCRECSTVYESTIQSCPKCGATNNCTAPTRTVVHEGQYITESYEPVFNLLD